MASESPRIQAIRSTLRHLQVGRLADAAMAGALLALFLAAVLGRLKLDVVGSLGTLCLILVLLLLAAYDLFVRWSSVDLQSPDRKGPGVQKGFRRLLQNLWPEVVLVLGIATGHLLWTG